MHEHLDIGSPKCFLPCESPLFMKFVLAAGRTRATLVNELVWKQYRSSVLF